VSDPAHLDLLARERDYLASQARLEDELAAWDFVVPDCPAELLAAPPYDVPPCECSCCAGPDAPTADEPAAAQPVLASPEAGWAVPGVTWETPAAPVAAAVGAAVTSLTELVATLASVRPTLLPPALALAETEALVQAQVVLRTLLLSRLADVETRALYELAGRKSTRGWLRQVAPDVVPSDVTLGKKLAGLVSLDQALSAGQVSIGAAQQVRKALDKLRRYLDRPDGLIDEQPAEPAVANVIGHVQQLIATQHCGLPDDSPLLVEVERQLATIVLSALEGTSQADRLEQAFTLLARHLPPDTALAGAVELLVGALLPNELERQQAAAEERRGLRLTPKPNGRWHLEADLTAEAGERLHAALGAEARRDRHNPLDTEAWQALRAQAEAEGRDVADLLAEHPDLPPPDPWDPTGSTRRPGPDEPGSIALFDEPARTRSDGTVRRPRLTSQRLHDALNNLLDRYLSCGLGGEHGKVPVQATVTMTAALIEGQPGALPAVGGSGRPLPRSLVRRWWNDLHLTALLMTNGYQPLGVVHTGRTLTAPERKACLAQHGNRCAGTDCCDGLPHPLTRLIPHHVDTYATTGTTSLSTTVPSCEVMHDDIHIGKRTVQLRDGRWINEQGVVSNPLDQPTIWDDP